MVPNRIMLKYRRETDSWVCPCCDMENSTFIGNCLLCRTPRTPDALFLKHWTEADEVPVAPRVAPPAPAYRTAPPPGTPYRTVPPRTMSPGIEPPRTTSGPIFKDDGYEGPPDNSNSGAIIAAILCAVIFVVILIAVAVNA